MIYSKYVHFKTTERMRSQSRTQQTIQQKNKNRTRNALWLKINQQCRCDTNSNALRLHNRLIRLAILLSSHRVIVAKANLRPLPRPTIKEIASDFHNQLGITARYGGHIHLEAYGGV